LGNDRNCGLSVESKRGVPSAILRQLALLVYDFQRYSMGEILKGKTTKSNYRAALAVGLTSLLCWAFTFLATNVFKDYAWGLFIWLPLVLGATSTIIYGYNNPTAKHKLFNISFWTLLVFCSGLLLFAWKCIHHRRFALYLCSFPDGV
jgi:hypothetical protein